MRQTILIVDDSHLNLRILKDILQAEYHILCATSGEQALVIVAEENVDLIILDVIMPGLNGYDVCKTLKEDPRTQNIPVMFLSAMEDVEDEKMGLETGAIDYIVKPVRPTIIKVRVKNHLELKRYRDILERQSLIDGLTGLANRRYFEDFFDKEWRRALRTADNLSVIMLDVDYFKKFNDTYGHLAGDDCLRRVGEVLQDSIRRAGDLVARYGGEEFVIVLPSTPTEGAMIIAEKIRCGVESLKIEHKPSDVSRYVTISAGVATVVPEMGMEPSSLIKPADSALYVAKSRGRNRVHTEQGHRAKIFMLCGK